MSSLLYPCPSCKSAKTRKNGHVRGIPRRKCKACGRQFLVGHASRSQASIPPYQRLMAITLYRCGLSLTKVAKIFSCQPATVMYWNKKYHQTAPPQNPPISIPSMPLKETLVVLPVGADVVQKSIQEVLKSAGRREQVYSASMSWLVGNSIIIWARLSDDDIRRKRNLRKRRQKG